MQVIKKDGSKEDFDIEKVVAACRLAASNCSKTLYISDEHGIRTMVNAKIMGRKKDITTTQISKYAITALKVIDPEISEAYKNYHQFRKNIIGELHEIRRKVDSLKYAGDRENANYDSSLFSTQSAIYRGWHSRMASKSFYLNKAERDAIKCGKIYIHDLRDIMFGNHNCCVFDMAKVLSGGFTINGVRTNEPRRVYSACGCIYDIINTAASQQFGGFTVPEIDKIIAKYAYIQWGGTGDVDGTIEDIYQAVEGLQHHINSNVSARGDTPFVTFTYGNLDLETDEKMLLFQKTVCLALHKTRRNKAMNFPKLVCLYRKEVMDEHPDFWRDCILTNKAAMYPDYVSLDAGDSGYLYNKYGLVHSPMGCRSFPTPLGGWDKPRATVGLFNVGVCSLNLPLIYQSCLEGDAQDNAFFEEIKKYVDIAIGYLDRRYDQVASCRCASNPLMFCEGGCVGGTKKPDELVGDIVNNMGASIGITALNELCVLMYGCPLHRANQDEKDGVLDVVNYISDLIEEKNSDKRHYSLYGTPAESLCGTQCEQFRVAYGIIPGVSDKPYFSNSFHMSVDADIDPYQKQDLEREFFYTVSGGHIQYVRIDNPENIGFISNVIKRGMRYGFYQGVNLMLKICPDCGTPLERKPVCSCGSENPPTIIGRVCGYLGNLTRMNDAKLAEIAERRSM